MLFHPDLKFIISHSSVQLNQNSFVIKIILIPMLVQSQCLYNLVVMESGRISKQGSYPELMERSGSFAEFLRTYSNIRFSFVSSLLPHNVFHQSAIFPALPHQPLNYYEAKSCLPMQII